MKITHFSITSATSLDFEFTANAPVCVFWGRYSDLALDLIRELIGDCGAQNDPDRVDDGRFVMHADIEIDSKNFSVCCIRNADLMGEHRLAVNFEPDSIHFSEAGTLEFIQACKKLGSDNSNILVGSSDAMPSADRRPLFIYDCFDRIDEATDLTPLLNKLSSLGRQVFISVCSAYPLEKVKHEHVQTVKTDSTEDWLMHGNTYFMQESIHAALRGEYGKRVLPSPGALYDEDRTVIICPVCMHKTLDNHDICPHCGWEYDGFPEDHYSAANGATLSEYRKYYEKSIKERNFKNV